MQEVLQSTPEFRLEMPVLHESRKHISHNARDLDTMLDAMLPGDHAPWGSVWDDEKIECFVANISGLTLRHGLFALRAYRETRKCKESNVNLFGERKLSSDVVRRMYGTLGWVFNLWPCKVPFAFAVAMADSADSDEGQQERGITDAGVFKRVLARVMKAELCTPYREILARDQRCAHRLKVILSGYFDLGNLTVAMH